MKLNPIISKYMPHIFNNHHTASELTKNVLLPNDLQL